MSLRYRLWLSFAPLLLLLGGLGAGAVYALGLVGDRIDGILRENYRSVDAVTGLNEGLERIDSSFPLALAGRSSAEAQYDRSWAAYRRNFEFERRNVTAPGEAELVAQLAELTERYRALGDRFFEPGPGKYRNADYYGTGDRPGALQTTFADIKRVTIGIRRVNQDSMERASANARRTAAAVRRWAALGLAVALAATGLLAWWTTRAILRTLDDLTCSARAVGDGRFDQVVIGDSRDEVGELVSAFNRMTAQLRDLRQSQTARLLRAQQASQAAIDAFPDPVLLIDPGGRVEMANPVAGRLLGVVPGDDTVAPPWQPPDVLRKPLAGALEDQRPFLTRSFEQAVTYQGGGEERVYLPQVLPVRDPYGATLGAVVVLNDVTQFRLLDEFKSDLVATASHELKTPLAGLRLAVHLLLEEEAVGSLNDKQAELLIDARDNTERLVQIVNHLLSLARLERGREQLVVRPEEPAALIRAAADRARPMINGVGLGVDVGAEPLPLVAADAQRLGQALDNLLVNAATYTDPGGRITLSARRRGDGEVELAVGDTGVGIPPEYLPYVFDKFFRIPGRSRAQGTGLGLAIVKEVVTAHGGAVACESEPGQGTTFRLTLPAWSNGRPEDAP